MSLQLFVLASTGSAEEATAVERGRLEVSDPAGALAYVDGVFAGEIPFETEVAPGGHTLDIFARGHVPFRQTVSVAAGETTTLGVSLDLTAQRVGAAVLLPVGAAGLLAGVALGAYSLSRPEEGFENLFEVEASEGPTAGEARLAAGIAAGIGAAIFAVGGGLFVFDTPPLPDGASAELRLAPGGVSWRASF